MKKLLRILLLTSFCVTLCGCLGSKYVTRNYYVLRAPTTGCKVVPVKKPYVVVNHASIVSQFDQLFFLYRLNANQYTTDYYNGFLVSAGEQIDAILLKYLRTHGHFYPITVEANIQPQVILQPRITALYADYRDKQCPQAVLAMQFIFTQGGSASADIIFDRTFKQSIPLQAKTTDSLIIAWNKCLQLILQNLVQTMNQVNLKPATSVTKDGTKCTKCSSSNDRQRFEAVDCSPE